LFFTKNEGEKEKATKEKSGVRDVPSKLKIALLIVLLKVRKR